MYSEYSVLGILYGIWKGVVIGDVLGPFSPRTLSPRGSHLGSRYNDQPSPTYYNNVKPTPLFQRGSVIGLMSLGFL